jgi:hypothetical protein
MLPIEDNELLTRTGLGTPMGDLFRRFWIPVPGSDCAQVRVTLLGEKLVAFQNSQGRVRVVDPWLPMRLLADRGRRRAHAEGKALSALTF